MKSKRIVITGLGIISPIGIGKKAFWEGILAGKTNITKISSFNPRDFSIQVAAQVDFRVADYIETNSAKKMDRAFHFGLIAAREAVQDAKLEIRNPERVGISMGITFGGIGFGEKEIAGLSLKGPRRVNPYLSIAFFHSGGLGQIAIDLKARGPCGAFPTGATGGADAIGFALKTIQQGKADIMLAGGTEAPITPLCLNTLSMMKILSPTICRPFDKNRAGSILGEGSAILVLEELGHALERRAEIYAEVIGYSTVMDPHDPFVCFPKGKGLQRVMEIALQKSQLNYGDVDYINAHGDGTKEMDKVETAAIKKVFKEHAYKLAVSSTKSMVGHALGAAGAIEFLATVMSIRNNVIPPTVNYETSDPECDLDYVPNVCRREEVKVALSNSCEIGGKNSSLIARKYQESGIIG